MNSETFRNVASGALVAEYSYSASGMHRLHAEAEFALFTFHASEVARMRPFLRPSQWAMDYFPEFTRVSLHGKPLFDLVRKS